MVRQSPSSNQFYLFKTRILESSDFWESSKGISCHKDIFFSFSFSFPLRQWSSCPLNTSIHCQVTSTLAEKPSIPKTGKPKSEERREYRNNCYRKKTWGWGRDLLTAENRWKKEILRIRTMDHVFNMFWEAEKVEMRRIM